ncbi:EF-hand domain-containing protein [Croceibacter atlanticus]|jgi:Ca2+-binding EF-hand superfamily protein|uniref:EF-hand domain-containing protein n=1 Tax=Croceibacter atlanticus TaxID=313588 RepID=UPI0024B9B76E|nr:EF-hand domain-containing protein [Croceibacter atlanticus]
MKNSKLNLAMLAMVFSLGLTSVTCAQSQRGNDRNERKEPPTYANLLKEMDKNDDGKLAKAELKGPLKNDFKKIDTNEDGFISEEEFKKAPKPERKERKERN